jgi:glycosyltransferase involved in cell wall biosynthesis
MISVIIPTYNSARYLKEAIDSVLAQNIQSLEIIVVDDGSTDETEQAVASYAELKKIVYLKKNNGGPASARNFGIKNSTGEFIAFLDADDIWNPDKLAKQMTLFKDPRVGLVYSRRIFLPNNKLDQERLYSGFVTKELINNNFITNSSVIIRRAIYNQAGPFREEKRFIAIEDYNFWLRISTLCQFAYSDEGLVYYRTHGNQISNTYYLATIKNIIKLYFGMFFDGRFRHFWGLISFKVLQNIKGYMIIRIKPKKV